MRRGFYFNLGFLSYLLGSLLFFGVVFYLYFFSDISFPHFFLVESFVFFVLGFLFYRWSFEKLDFSTFRYRTFFSGACWSYYLIGGLFFFIVYLIVVFYDLGVLSSFVLFFVFLFLFFAILNILVRLNSKKDYSLLMPEEWTLVLLMLLVFLSLFFFLFFIIFFNF